MSKRTAVSLEKCVKMVYNIAQKYKNLASLCIERLKYLFYNKYEN